MKKILWWEPLLDSSDSRAASKAIKMNYPNEGLFTKKLASPVSRLVPSLLSVLFSAVRFIDKHLNIRYK